jgi:hypothetical protein
MIKNADYSLEAIVVFDKDYDNGDGTRGRIIGVMDFAKYKAFGGKTGLLPCPNYVTISPRGTKVIYGLDILPNNHPDNDSIFDGTHAWDLDFRNPVKVSVPCSHWGWAYDHKGNEMFVSQNSSSDWIEAVNIVTGEVKQILYHGDLGWLNGWHFALMPESAPGWVLMSTYAYPIGCEYGNPKFKHMEAWGDNQLIMLEIKDHREYPPPRIWRLGPTYDELYCTKDKIANYWAEGFAVMSTQGDRLWWTTRWPGQRRSASKTDLEGIGLLSNLMDKGIITEDPYNPDTLYLDYFIMTLTNLKAELGPEDDEQEVELIWDKFSKIRYDTYEMMLPKKWVKDLNTLSRSDKTPPDPITDLRVERIDSATLRLTWTAPADKRDDGAENGSAASYDIRYREYPSFSGNWYMYPMVNGEPAPEAPGTEQGMIIKGFPDTVTYYFAIKSDDRVGNVSIISNIASEGGLGGTVSYPDSNADGVPDNKDIFPYNRDEQYDTDGDGIGDNADTDDDNDGMPDEWETRYGLDPLVDDASKDLDLDDIINKEDPEPDTPNCSNKTIHIYRSVGPGNMQPLATGYGNALNISGDAAEFTLALPNNIGLGDVIQYDSDGDNMLDSVCFIHRRKSSSSYQVKNRFGDIPVSTNTITQGWSILRAYTSLYNAERGVENEGLDDALENFDEWIGGRDLVCINKVWNIACYADGVDTDYVTIEGWTTGENNYIRIYTPVSAAEAGVSQRHSGVWTQDAYAMMVDTAYLRSPLRILEGYVRVEGLQIGCIASSNRWHVGIDVTPSSSASDIQVSNNIITGDFSGTADFLFGIKIGDSLVRPGTARIWNNIIYGIKRQGAIRSGGIYNYDTPLQCSYIYNNTVYDCTVGIRNAGANGGAVLLKNNLCNGNIIDYLGYFTMTSNNISEDSTSPDPDYRNTAVAFVNKEGYDLRLSGSDTSAIDNGADLSSDLYLPFSTDILNNERPSFGWDIGAYEYIADR